MEVPPDDPPLESLKKITKVKVKKVKTYLNGIIRNPVTFSPEQTVAEMLEAKRENAYPFSGFPIVKADGTLMGILTARDLKFLTNYKVKIGKVMNKCKIVAPDGLSMQEAYKLMMNAKVGKLPTVDPDGNWARGHRALG